MCWPECYPSSWWGGGGRRAVCSRGHTRYTRAPPRRCDATGRSPRCCSCYRSARSDATPTANITQTLIHSIQNWQHNTLTWAARSLYHFVNTQYSNYLTSLCTLLYYNLKAELCNRLLSTNALVFNKLRFVSKSVRPTVHHKAITMLYK